IDKFTRLCESFVDYVTRWTHTDLARNRRLHSELGAENYRDRRATRQTRFPRRKAIFGRQKNILPRFSALSLHCSAAATTKLYARLRPVTRVPNAISNHY